MAVNQSQMFLKGMGPPKVRDTSVAALQQSRAKAGGVRERVLDILRNVGESGLTDEQLAERMMLAINRVVPRRHELVKKGLVVHAGFKRRTRSGCQALVWKIKP